MCMRKTIVICGLIMLASLLVLGVDSSKKSPGRILTKGDVMRLVKQEGFFCKCYDWNREFCNPEGGYKNDFKADMLSGNAVVIDRASGLMWHQGGSFKSLRFNDVGGWIDELNRTGYAGYKDWRLPTLKEAATLLENAPMNGNLYIDPLFSTEQGWIWSSDICSSSGGWVVTFAGGTIGMPKYGLFYVRPVRSF